MKAHFKSVFYLRSKNIKAFIAFPTQKSIRISSHNPKNIQEGRAEIICEYINILSHPYEM